jgi:1-acyl-sn-glycerol-3-phosphate acyltransferase
MDFKGQINMFYSNTPTSTNNEAIDYNKLVLLTLCSMMAAYTLSKSQQIKYDSYSARLIAGVLMLMMRLMHTRDDDLEIVNDDRKIITAGPHRTGWEAFVLASKMKGTPPRFFATTAFNNVPGVSFLMNMFSVITVDAKAKKSDHGPSANAGTLEMAHKALKDKGCVVLFPQGGFSRIGEDPCRVYDGAARLAVESNTAIHAIRLDGYWCLQNPIIPLFVRNHTFYRAFFSGMHMNNVRTTLCDVIDVHLKPESEQLTTEQKMEQINAQLYAYYRHTNELTPKQIEAVKTEITENRHLDIWRNKIQQETNKKALIKLKEEEVILEEPTSLAMK